MENAYVVVRYANYTPSFRHPRGCEDPEYDSAILLRIHTCEPSNGTLYIGVTNNLQRRVWEHKNGTVEGFTKQYNVHMLVYYEHFPSVTDAIRREKHLKHWNRAWKLRLIEEKNPQWRDMYEDWQNPGSSPPRG